MAETFEGRDLTDAIFWEVDLSGARFRDVNLTGLSISHSWVVDVDIDGIVEHLTINGVDVTNYVNEHDPWYSLRSRLRPSDPAGMREAWREYERSWSATIDRARRLDESELHESVGGESSFVQTLRHLLFAMDKWFTTPILGEGFSPIGLPNTGSLDFGWPGLDLAAQPSFDETLAARESRTTRFREYLESVGADDLEREVVVLENGNASVRQCVHVVFEEEFHHQRYALRDLAVLEGANG
jgi:DinB superfamily/Pentapeptide repeats (8 copies)